MIHVQEHISIHVYIQEHREPPDDPARGVNGPVLRRIQTQYQDCQFGNHRWVALSSAAKSNSNLSFFPDESLFQVDAASIMLEKQWRLPSQLLGAEGLPMRSPSVDWADRCLYECKECRPSETFDTHSKVSYHVKKRHCMAMKDYTTRHGRAMVYEEKHTCQVNVVHT